MKGNRPTVVSLFCGAGGMDLGLTQAGLDIIWANDNDKDCIATYKNNFKHNTTTILGDVARIMSDDIPSSDLIVGGFPCQGFSVANKYRTVDDSRNKLYLEMLRIVRDKRPKWFIAENVRGIMTIGKGAVIEKIVDDFRKAGYEVKYDIVNMADFGVPQLRKRVIILGTRSDLPRDCQLRLPKPTHSATGDSVTEKWVTFNEALQELDRHDDIPDKMLGSKYKLNVRDFTGHRRSDGDRPSPTILARGDGGGGVNATPHPNGLRRLSVRESARIQTFPVGFTFSGGVNAMYRQIGNAVPVLYARRLGEMVVDVLERYQLGRRFTVVSLFSGAGGMDLGFRNAGFDIIWANDNDQDAVGSYKANLGDHIVLRDIEQIMSEEIPNAEVIVGGFPCQGFSVANMGRSSSDPRNKLYKNFVRIVADKKPKLFLAENVKGILSLEKGEVFRLILKEFSSIGYRCQYKVLNAADYGTPQTRERVFILGVRQDCEDGISFPPSKTHSRHPDPLVKPWVSISEALSAIPDPDRDHLLKNHVYSRYKLKFNGYLNHRAIDPSKPSPTITARGDDKGGAMINHHPSNKRRLSCRELACLQDFPLDFLFVGSMTSVYRQVGNAVPVNLARAMAQAIKEYLRGLHGVSEPRQLEMII